MNLLGVLEGILFVVGDEGITLNQICEILNVDLEESKRLLMELKKTYETEDRGIRISYLGDAFKLTTKKEHKDYYKKLIENPKTNDNIFVLFIFLVISVLAFLMLAPVKKYIE